MATKKKKKAAKKAPAKKAGGKAAKAGGPKFLGKGYDKAGKKYKLGRGPGKKADGTRAKGNVQFGMKKAEYKKLGIPAGAAVTTFRAH